MLFKVLIPVTILVLMDTANTSKIFFEGSTCIIPSGEVGVCTQLKLCKSIYEDLLSRRITIQDPSLFKCGSLATGTIICCPDEKPKTTKRKPQLEKPEDDSVLFSYEYNEDDKVDSVNNNRNNSPLKTSIIIGMIQGLSRPADIACSNYTFNLPIILHRQIFGGIKSNPGEFPHMVSLGFNDILDTNYIWKCAGSLISDSYVLTAAHCVANARFQPKIMRIGKTSILNNEDGQTGMDIGIQETIIHPDYRLKATYHDIALLKLAHKITFTKFMRPACLYTGNTEIPPNTDLYATGWGPTESDRKSQNWLLKVKLNIYPDDDCKMFYKTNRPFETSLEYGIHDGQICTYDKNLSKDTCKGDSGGPLQLLDERKSISTIVGVTSFGFGCALESPGVYAKISYYLDWIENIVWPE